MRKLISAVIAVCLTLASFSFSFSASSVDSVDRPDLGQVQVRQMVEAGNIAYGKGNFAVAGELYRKAADQGNAEAQLNYGVFYYMGIHFPQDYAEAMKWYMKAAEQGNGYAQINIGTMYYNGFGIVKNYSDALKWFHKAAEQGYAEAEYNIGIMYANGFGVHQNNSEAAKWFLMAAERGFVEAQLIVGAMYALGRGVPQSYERAYMWVSLVASKGDAKAANLREIAASHLSTAQLVEAQRLARDWRPSAKQHALAEAQIENTPGMLVGYTVQGQPQAQEEPQQQHGGQGFISNIPSDGYTAKFSQEEEAKRQATIEAEDKARSVVAPMPWEVISLVTIIFIVAATGFAFYSSSKKRDSTNSDACKAEIPAFQSEDYASAHGVLKSTADNRVNAGGAMGGSFGVFGAIAFFLVGIAQLFAGYAGISHELGTFWAIAAAIVAFVFRFTLPLTIGSFFGAMNVWGWHWFASALFALPGLAFVIPGVIASMISGIRGNNA